VDDTVGSEDGVAADEDRYDPEELRYAPQAPKRFRWLKRILVLAVVLALFALIGKLAYDWSQDQYYVGESDGVVAIYQGVPQEVPGIDLSDVDSPTSISLDSLPTYSQEQVRDGLNAESLDDAQAIVADLESLANKCADSNAEDCEGADGEES